MKKGAPMKRELAGLVGWHTEQGPLLPVVPPKQVFKDRKSNPLFVVIC